MLHQILHVLPTHCQIWVASFPDWPRAVPDAAPGFANIVRA